MNSRTPLRNEHVFVIQKKHLAEFGLLQEFLHSLYPHCDMEDCQVLVSRVPTSVITVK